MKTQGTATAITVTEDKTALTLTREVGQSIDVAGPCRIVVTRLNNRRCRITVLADRSVAVKRTELCGE